MIGRYWSRLLLVVALALCVPVSAAAQDVVEYYGTDAIGSVRIVFDASGTVVGRMDYGPFGEQVTVSTVGHKSYAGLFRDGEAGLDYAEARMFQPRTGRFNAPDPVYAGAFEPQLWNRYSYALNNPMTFSDPQGLLPVTCTNVTRVIDGDGYRFLECVESPPPARPDRLPAEFGGGGRGNQPTTPKTPAPPSAPTEPPVESPPTVTDECQQVPQAPPGVDIEVNIRDAHEVSNYWEQNGTKWFGRDKLEAFRSLVQNKGPWDYKQQGRKYENFGNFNFGATGSAMGYSENFLLRGAGWAQGQGGNKGVGSWLGSYPFGDDPRDSLFIRRGVHYYRQRHVTRTCQ